MQDSPIGARVFFCLVQIVHYVILVYFVYAITVFIESKTPISWLWARLNACVCAACILVWIAAACSSGLFEQMARMNSGLYWLASFGNIYMLATQIGLLLRFHKVFRRLTFLSCLLFSLCPVVLLALRFLFPQGEISAVVLSFFVLLVYGFVYLVQRHDAQQTQLLLSEAKLSVLISQTQPHFLYNTLNFIYYLCEKDPAAAQRAINDFAEFLHNNMESINNSNTVPFQKEMEHVQHYLALEKLRFQDDLQTEFRIGAQAFQIPPLCVQMLTENAVKYGIEKKQGGGTVCISTAETPDGFLVSVTDNGVGFDVSAAENSGGMGIAITRLRLQQKCRGTLTIRSEIGKGTEATIWIPKNSGGNSG